jgi:DNA-binding transcriptional ArsR family regulator
MVMNNQSPNGYDMLPADRLFKALSDPTRRALFERLCQSGELPVHALTEVAGISQPAVSKHLSVLRKAGLVIGREDGRQVQYRADARALVPLADWMGRYAAFWDEKLDHLDDLLKRMDQ